MNTIAKFLLTGDPAKMRSTSVPLANTMVLHTTEVPLSTSSQYSRLDLVLLGTSSFALVPSRKYEAEWKVNSRQRMGVMINAVTDSPVKL